MTGCESRGGTRDGDVGGETGKKEKTSSPVESKVTRNSMMVKTSFTREDLGLLSYSFVAKHCVHETK